MGSSDTDFEKEISKMGLDLAAYGAYCSVVMGVGTYAMTGKNLVAGFFAATIVGYPLISKGISNHLRHLDEQRKIERGHKVLESKSQPPSP